MKKKYLSTAVGFKQSLLFRNQQNALLVTIQNSLVPSMTSSISPRAIDWGPEPSHLILFPLRNILSCFIRVVLSYEQMSERYQTQSDSYTKHCKKCRNKTSYKKLRVSGLGQCARNYDGHVK